MACGARFAESETGIVPLFGTRRRQAEGIPLPGVPDYCRFVGIKIVPLYVADYQLKDKMTETAKFAIVNRYTEDQIKDNIFRTIQDLDIPAKRDDVKVTNTNHGLAISVNYTVPVDFLVYKTDINFDTSSEGRDYMK